MRLPFSPVTRWCLAVAAVAACAIALEICTAWAQPVEIAPPGGPVSGTHTCGETATPISATPLLVVAAAFRNADATNSLKLGATTPAFTLPAGQMLGADTANLGLWYCQRVGGADVTLEYLGVKAK